LEIALANTDREARMAAGQTVAATTTNDVGGGGGWSTVVTPSASTKKVNWDLKRDIQHKMDKLEKRTQRAIVQLLRERLEKEAETAGGVDDYDDEVGDID
jgi:coiled-coil domain-containing protein 12